MLPMSGFDWGQPHTHRLSQWPIAPCSDKMPKSELIDSGLLSGTPIQTDSLWL